jgi:hypothetical protein
MRDKFIKWLLDHDAETLVWLAIAAIALAVATSYVCVTKLINIY